MEIGTYLGEGPARAHGMILNLMIGGMVILNTLAFQFKWSRSTTACLRGAAWIWIVAVFAAIVFYR
jgi:hypothetical protein